MTDVIPAILPKSYHELEEKVSLVSSHVPIVQVDICDGRFVPSKTWPYFSNDHTFEKILNEDVGMPLWDTIDYEIDLMVSKPDLEFEKWVRAGAARIILHIESAPDMKKIFDQYKGVIGIGLAINPQTSLDTILPYIHDIDFLQCMGIQRIGYQGQTLDDDIISRITSLRESHPDLIISVDGGVTLDNAQLLVTAGARRLVSGSAIFESTNPLETIHALESL